MGEESTKPLAKQMHDELIPLSGSIESRREEPLLSLLKELGGWPTLEGANWDEANFRCEAKISYARVLYEI